MKLFSLHKANSSKNQLYSIIAFSFLIGWIISLPYEGPVFYSLISRSAEDYSFINSFSLFALATGLLIPVFFRFPETYIQQTLIVNYCFCLALSLPLPMFPEEFWPIVMPLIAFCAGSALSLNGYSIKLFYPYSMWSSVAPDAMILSCTIIICAHFLVTVYSFPAGFVFIEIILMIAIICLIRLNPKSATLVKTGVNGYPDIFSTFWLLFVFIFLIAINAGILFQVVYPKFEHHGTFVSVYTNLPYVAAIIVFSKVHKGNKFNALFLGLALWGVALLIVPRADSSLLSFLVICTTMLFASGIFDLFWWSVSTTSFSYVKNPSAMIGSILAVNVLGSWFGGVLSNYMVLAGMSLDSISLIGLSSVFMSMVLIVPLNKQISSLIRNNKFLEAPHWNVVDYTDTAIREALSSRELEVFDLLRQGLSDKDIGSRLHITVSTVKTHNRKIYKKLEVSNRTELRRNFTIPN
jgi:DNA-binding CsgD family transcriptional regulator